MNDKLIKSIMIGKGWMTSKQISELTDIDIYRISKALRSLNRNGLAISKYFKYGNGKILKHYILE